MSDLLRLLTKNEQMSVLLIFLVNRSFAHFWLKRAIRSKKPMSEFPALLYSEYDTVRIMTMVMILKERMIRKIVIMIERIMTMVMIFKERMMRRLIIIMM